jgi:hypothetical protein
MPSLSPKAASGASEDLGAILSFPRWMYVVEKDLIALS